MSHWFLWTLNQDCFTRLLVSYCFNGLLVRNKRMPEWKGEYMLTYINYPVFLLAPCRASMKKPKANSLLASKGSIFIWLVRFMPVAPQILTWGYICAWKRTVRNCGCGTSTFPVLPFWLWCECIVDIWTLIEIRDLYKKLLMYEVPFTRCSKWGLLWLIEHQYHLPLCTLF